MQNRNSSKKKPRKSLIILICLIVFVAAVFLNNGPLFTKERTGRPFLLAHRGLAQTFSLEGVESDTCTATRIYPPEYPYLENTIPSMQAAFQLGADLVEFDIYLTKDGKFAVFHDHTLECRTEANGRVRDYTLAELKKLDVGYGYSADGGKTYPFRGKGVGLMPSLDEILTAFPEQALLIHIKSGDPEEGRQLAHALSLLPAKRLQFLTVYGSDQPIATLSQILPQMRVMSRATIQECLLQYIAIGWTGIVPTSCQNRQLHVPEKIAPWLWGWPDRFLDRMEASNARVILVEGDGSGFSSGFDTPEDIERLPDGYTGGIWTNRIDRIAPLFRK